MLRRITGAFAQSCIGGRRRRRSKLTTALETKWARQRDLGGQPERVFGDARKPRDLGRKGARQVETIRRGQRPLRIDGGKKGWSSQRPGKDLSGNRQNTTAMAVRTGETVAGKRRPNQMLRKDVLSSAICAEYVRAG